ncbi:LOW QUALITY PROTEIN: protein RRP5 homolog [Amphiura filiformis]|uniref:LOW QUALITY PROTEIN: protein RRP5 homolog n=1 Tax=Amphiura filiformis TaxID=82378 RepID=UPI003B22224D
MEEEDFPRRTRSSAAAVKPTSEKKGPNKKTKEKKKDEDRFLFQEEKPKRISKRKMKETQSKADTGEQKRKKVKTKQASKQKKKPADDDDDQDDDDDDDDLGLKFLDDSDDDDFDDDDDDEESTKPKKKVKEKLKKKDKKKGKEAKKMKAGKRTLEEKDEEEDESDESSDEDEEKTKKKKAKPLKGSLDEDVEAFDGGVRRRPFVNLTQKTITTDMLLLAVVKEARDYEIVLSLPGGSSGFLPITSISDIYTKRLEKLSNNDEEGADDDDDKESIPRPKAIFTVGSLLGCKVKSVESTPTGRPRIQVSVKPSEVNANLTPSSIRQGMVLNGCVSSKEDHGYMVDMGISKVQAFLGWKEARRFVTERNMGKPLYIGQPIQCLVTKVQGNGRSLVLNADPSEVAKAMANKESHNSLQTLLPGTKVTATIVKTSKDHLVVTVLDNYSGHIAHIHLEDNSYPMDHYKPKQQSYLEITVLDNYSGHLAHIHLEDNSYPMDHYKPKQQVTGTIICNNQILKTVAISLNPYHMTSHFEVNVHSPFAQLRQGITIEQARLLRVDPKTGLLVKINNKLRGVVHQSQLPEKDGKKWKEIYRSGQQVSCRIIDFNWFDALAMLSMKKSTMDQPFLGYHDIRPGVNVEGSVYSFSDKGVKVQVADRTFGFVPNSHMADIPISKPKDKYKVGDKLKLRVLTVDSSHRRLVLTHKKTLVESILPVVTAYDQAERDTMLHGFIVAVKDFGCIVSFYNDVKGLIPTKELSSDPTLIPSQAFHFGQVVKCRVIQTHHPSMKKITLSLRRTGTVTQTKKPVDANIHLGQVESVQVTNVASNGLEVTLTSDENSKGFIPMMHLSDHHDNCKALLASYKEGSVIEDAMYWAYSGHKACPIFTCKRSIIKTAGDKMMSDLKNLESGMMLMGHVKRIMDYGVFVEANSNLVGLAPKGALSDNFIPNTDLLKIGQTVRAQVTQVDNEKSRFLVSLRSSQCPSQSDEGMKLLEDYLSEREELCKRLAKGEYKHIVKLTPGTSVTATVREKDGYQLICTLPHDIKGIKSDMNDIEYEAFGEGDEIDACVLHSDIHDKTVYLSIKPELLEYDKIKKTPKKKASKSKGKKEATVEFVHDHFVLAFVAGEGFVYLPRRKHLNDIQLGKDIHTVGQTLTVAIKRVVNGHQLAQVIREKGTKMESDDSEKKAAVKLSKAEKLGQVPELQVGQMVSAIIKSVKDLQLYVTTDKGIYGRVHVTEITDDMQPGISPLASFKVGDTIQAKVIGHREIKEHKFLPITHRGFKRMGLELSMKKSVLENSEIDESSLEAQLASYKNSQNVMVVIHKYHKNILWVTLKPGITGKVYQLNLSKRPGILNDPAPYFKPGSVHQAQVLLVDEEQQVVELTMAGNTSLELANGAVLNGRITNVQPDFGIHVQLPHGLHGTVHITDIQDEYRDNPMKGLLKNHCVRCYVKSCDNKDNIVLSMKPSLLGHKSNVNTGRPLETISQVKEGQLLKGYVKKISDKGVFLSLSRTLVGRIELRKISSQYFLHVDQLQQAFPFGKMLSVKVISVDESSQKIELSCCHGDTGLPDQVPVKFQATRRTDIEVEESLKSKKRTSSTSDAEVEGETKKKRRRRKRTSESKEDSLIKKKRTDKVDGEGDASGAQRRKGSVHDGGVRRGQDSDSDSGVEEALSDTEVEVISKESSDKSEAPRLAVTAGFSWDNSAAMATKKTKPSVVKRGDDEDSSSSSSSEDESDKEEEKQQKPVKKSKKEIAEEKKAEEAYLYKTEHALMDSERTPETMDDFDRLVLSSPDSSLVWIRYMAYHLHSAEIEKARTVAERALKAISFREEQEKLNVWVAYMNLENMYGTEESLMQVFERALKFNEPIKVFQQLVNIYVRTEKIEAAEQLYGTMVKRFNFEKEVWINFGMFLMKHSKQDTARKLMQRSFKSLHEKEQVDVIVKFSQMEFKFGEVERGKTMFENVLSNYPKRTDIWSVYLDMMIKSGDIEATRHVFERVIHLTLSAKKMKFFFKRYLDFEKKYGTESTVDSVKQKAVEYVESKTAVGPSEES